MRAIQVASGWDRTQKLALLLSFRLEREQHQQCRLLYKGSRPTPVAPLAQAVTSPAAKKGIKSPLKSGRPGRKTVAFSWHDFRDIDK